MFQLLINKETQRSVMYTKNTMCPEGVIPNSLRDAQHVHSVYDGCFYAKCSVFVSESNVVCTDMGEFAIEKFDMGRIYFNIPTEQNTAVYVYGQKLPETHDLVPLPDEYNDAPETASFTRNDDGTYTFTLNEHAVASLKRHLLMPAILERTQKLKESDWTQAVDSPLSDEKKEAWRVYRKALRDFPNTYTGAPEDWKSSFPTPP